MFTLAAQDTRDPAPGGRRLQNQQCSVDGFAQSMFEFLVIIIRVAFPGLRPCVGLRNEI